MVERAVSIRRVTKVVKGGRVLSFSAIVVVGDGKGCVGIGKGCAKDTAIAVQKAARKALREPTKITTTRGTVACEVKGKFGASTVLLRPTKQGRGIIASDCVRAVLCAAGVTDVTAKCFGSTNPINVVFAVLDGLVRQTQKCSRKCLT